MSNNILLAVTYLNDTRSAMNPTSNGPHVHMLLRYSCLFIYTFTCLITGVNPSRYLDGFSWDEFKWRRGELLAQFEGCTVMLGSDDMDVFKGIELKLQAFERLLDHHPDWRGKLVLVQVWCV